jgi:hypothetical protein
MHEVLLEEKHWDHYAIKGKTRIEANCISKDLKTTIPYFTDV